MFREPEQNIAGAEGFHAPARVNPASRILNEMFATSTAMGENMDPVDTSRMAEAFVEGIVSLMARSFYSRAEEIRRLSGFSDSGAVDALRTAAALEAASDALETLLPPDKREDRRREF